MTRHAVPRVNVSARDAWAFGCTARCNRILIERWNGVAWKRVPSPGRAGYVIASMAVLAGSAWAVGCTDYCTKALIPRWNGTAWK